MARSYFRGDAHETAEWRICDRTVPLPSYDANAAALLTRRVLDFLRSR